MCPHQTSVKATILGSHVDLDKQGTKCGGKADERPAPAPIPVEPPTRRPSNQANAAPPPSARPKTNRPPTQRDRPSSQYRREHARTSAGPGGAPQTAHRQRAGTAGPGAERRKSSQGDNHIERQKAKFTGNEEFIEDSTIIELVKEITTFIDQHTRNFYPIDNPGRKENEDELNEPRTRHAAIRRYIAHAIIDSIVMDNENRSPDLRLIASNICKALAVNTNDDKKTVAAHLFEICKLGNELREAIDSHPSTWSFGRWDRVGYIVLMPAFLRDRQEVLGSQRFKST